MDGLFEDDANVRPQPKRKKSADKKNQPSRKNGVGSQIIDTIESRAKVVGAVSGVGVDFVKVDITPSRRGKQKKVGEDQGKIIPPINYVMDECNDDV